MIYIKVSFRLKSEFKKKSAYTEIGFRLESGFTKIVLTPKFPLLRIIFFIFVNESNLVNTSFYNVHIGARGKDAHIQALLHGLVCAPKFVCALVCAPKLI